MSEYNDSTGNMVKEVIAELELERETEFSEADKKKLKELGGVFSLAIENSVKRVHRHWISEALLLAEEREAEGKDYEALFDLLIKMGVRL